MSGLLEIDELSVQGFRGYDETVTFRLGAPLTLIYAANGTGKTSLCDAAEWLLTNKVDRLDLAKDDQVPDGLRCRFSSGERLTEVSGRIRTERGQSRLMRTVKGAFFEKSPDAWLALKDTDLLRRLVPWPAAPGVTAAVEAGQRRQWLWGARFFSIDTIGPLIDSGKDEDRREKIFADLLGTAHLLAHERKLDNVLSELRRPGKARDDEIARLRKQQSDLLFQVLPGQDGILAAGGRACARIRALLRQDEEMALMLPASPDQFATMMQSVERRLDQTRDRLERDRNSFGVVEGAVDRYHERREALAATRTDLDTAQRKIVNLRAEMAKAEAGFADLRNTRTSERNLLVRHVSELQALSDHLKTLPGGAPIAVQLESHPFASLAVDAMHRQTEACKRYIEDWPDYERALADIAETTAAAVILRDGLMTADADALVRRLEKATARWNEARAAFDAAAGPLELLKQYALRALESLPADHCHCPTCGYDWQTAADLRHAIEDDRDRAETALADLLNQVRAAEEEAAAAQVAQNDHNARQERLASLDRRRYQAGEQKRTFEQRLATVGLPSSVLASRQALENHRDQLAAALRLHEVADLAGRLDRVGWLHLPAADLAVAATATWADQGKSLDRLNRELDQAAAEHAEAQAHRQSAITDALALATVRQQHIDEQVGWLKPVESAWVSLAGDEALTAEAAARQRSALDELSVAMEQAESAWSEIQTCRRQLTERSQLDQVEANLARETQRRAVLTAEETRLSVLRDKVADYRKDYTRRQIEALCATLGEFFARMQANEVFERISGGDGDTPLQWAAATGSVDFNPTLHFSQGQRQDLALAVFLARARSLGGSFFLDEPIQHLDDLNRVALLDTLRTIALDGDGRLRLVVTTSSRSLLDHLAEKCRRIRHTKKEGGFLRIIELEGNPRLGARIIREEVFGG